MLYRYIYILLFAFVAVAANAQDDEYSESDYNSNSDSEYNADYNSEYNSDSEYDYNSDSEYYYNSDYDYSSDYDYDQGYEYKQPCEHKGNIQYFQILRYKPGMSVYDKEIGAKGKITLSNSCLEIDCYHLTLYFCINERVDVSPRYIKLTRCEADDTYDYIEIRQKNLDYQPFYNFYIAKIDENGYMHNTIVFSCKPYTNKKVTTK